MQGLDQAQRKQRLVEAVRTLTLRGAQRRPLFLLMEDLQWIDSSSRDYLDSVVDTLANHPVFLLSPTARATHRPGTTASLPPAAGARPVHRGRDRPDGRRAGRPGAGDRAGARAHHQAGGGQSPLHRGAHRVSEEFRAADGRRWRRARQRRGAGHDPGSAHRAHRSAAGVGQATAAGGGGAGSRVLPSPPGGRGAPGVELAAELATLARADLLARPRSSRSSAIASSTRSSSRSPIRACW